MRITKILPIVALTAVLASCNAPSGELVGAGYHGGFQEALPYGMVYIKKGDFMMGSNMQSAIFNQPDNQLMVTVDGFWMDETEITNNEYRQFVNWVRDSIAYRYLIDAGLTEYAILSEDEDEENARINWKKRIPWNSKEDEIKDALAPMFFEGEQTLNTTLFRYTYNWVNYDEAAKYHSYYTTTGKYPDGAYARIDSTWIDDNTNAIQVSTVTRALHSPKDLITSVIISVYPDTTIWVSDFQLSYNEPLLLKYFSHPGFAYYPVVGVTWEQAEAFCHWRTDYFLGNNVQDIQKYRLPTEAEWEYAARGGRKMAAYPWGGNYARDKEGCFLANFKPYRGGYSSDTGTSTMQVAQFRPNDYGLFDMAGNVAEWTASSYNTSANAYTHDLNPNLQYKALNDDPDVLKRKVVKGGSWKDISYYLQCGTRTYEYQYERRSYIGFRCVRTRIGG